MYKIKKLLTFVFTVVLCLSFAQFSVVKADSSGIKGELYKSIKDEKYNISSNNKIEIQDTNNKHSSSNTSNTNISSESDNLGELKITGNYKIDSEKNGITYISSKEDTLKFSYNFNREILKDGWKIFNDTDKEINNIKLEKEVGKGTIIVQTSKDNKIWVTDKILNNIFEGDSFNLIDFYQTNDIQMIDGTYFRVIVAYQLNKENNSGWIKNKIGANQENIEYVNLYNFFLKNDNNTDSEYKLTYSLGSKQLVTKDEGFSKYMEITDKNLHYGWDLGEFFVSGYSKNLKDEKDNLVFLKNTGDKVTLWFRLKQDINKLNNNPNLTIISDNNAIDNEFEALRQNFGKGALIVRFTDFHNTKTAPQVYKDFLLASVVSSADSRVQLLEEGDYEVALDYSIEKKNLIKNDNEDYKIKFKFSVRNGNTMIFPKDIETGFDLVNEATTKNGFYLDFARSRYLDINVKRETLNQGKNGLVEDVKFNKPAKDGDKYTEDGIYTITATNIYTKQVTSKKICVGSDYDLNKKFDEIKGQIVSEETTITSIDSNNNSNNRSNSVITSVNNIVDVNVEKNSNKNRIYIIGIVLTTIIAAIILKKKNK